jgi:hypothetical protein
VEKIFVPLRDEAPSPERSFDLKVAVKFIDKNRPHNKIQFSTAKYRVVYSGSSGTWFGGAIGVYTSPNRQRLLLHIKNPFASGFIMGYSVGPESLQLWDAAAGKLLFEETIPASTVLNGKGRALDIAAFSPDNTLVAFRVQQRERDSCSIELRNASTGAVLREFKTAELSFDNPKPIFSRDSRTLFVPCKDCIEIWDISDIKP